MKRFPVAVAGLVAAPILLAACGGDDSTTADGGGAIVGGGEPETTELTFAYFSSGVPSLPVFAAENLGYFDEAGLDVSFEEVGGPGDLMPLLATGQAQYAYAGYEMGFNAISGGIDLVLLRELQRNVELGQQLWAGPQSGVETLEDLEGKTIGLIGLGGFGDYLVAEALETVGLTLDDVDLVEVPPPTMIPSLLQGDIDAGWLPGPLNANVRVQEPPLTLVVDFEDIPSLEAVGIGGMFAERSFVQENANTTAAFVEAVDRAAAELAGDEELWREELAKVLPEELDPAAVDVHALYPYGGEVPVEELADYQERLVELGILRETVPLDEIVVLVE